MAHDRSRRPTAADWIQAVATLLAVMIALPTLWFARQALKDQQEINRSQIEINRSQIEINQQQQERVRQRYAAQVSLWTEWVNCPESGGYVGCRLRAHVENRAPIAITYVGVTVRDNPNYPNEFAGFAISLPPCIATFFDLNVDVVSTAAKPPGIALVFTDNTSKWIRADSGTLQSGNYPVPVTLNSLKSPPFRPIGDCGTGN